MTQESTPASCWITCASAASRFVQSTKKFGILVTTLSATPVVAERWDSKAPFFFCKHSIMFVREDGEFNFVFLEIWRIRALFPKKSFEQVAAFFGSPRDENRCPALLHFLLSFSLSLYGENFLIAYVMMQPDVKDVSMTMTAMARSQAYP